MVEAKPTTEKTFAEMFWGLVGMDTNDKKDVVMEDAVQSIY